MGPEDLPEPPLDAVADDGLAHPAADGQPQAVPSALAGSHEQREPLRPGLPARGIDAIEITPETETVLRGESMTSSYGFHGSGRLR
jgi:hypothetical protein